MSQRSISDMLKPLQTTPRRRQRVASISPDGDTIIVDSPSQDTPNTRKRARIDYNYLDKYGLSGRTESPTRSSQTSRTTIPKTLQSSQQLSQASTQETIDIAESQDAESDNEVGEEKKRKAGWFWSYFEVKVLDTTFIKKGKKKAGGSGSSDYLQD